MINQIQNKKSDELIDKNEKKKYISQLDLYLEI
jgi:hypothetical protein